MKVSREEQTKFIIHTLESLGFVEADTPERAAQIKAENEDPEIVAAKVKLIEDLLTDPDFSKIFKRLCKNIMLIQKE